MTWEKFIESFLQKQAEFREQEMQKYGRPVKEPNRSKQILTLIKGGKS